MIKIEGGFICHPDCRGGAGVVAAPREPRPSGKAEA